MRSRNIPNKIKLTGSVILIYLLLTNTSIAQDKNKEFHLDETYNVNTSGKIRLSSDDAHVFIIGSNRKDVHVKIDRVVDSGGISWGDKRFDVTVEVEDGNLVIRDREWGSSGMIGYTREEYVIKIEAPASMKLDIKGDDGDYEITNMANDLKIIVDDGDIEINNFSGSSTYLDLDDGDVIMRGGRGKLSVKMDDGDLFISDGYFEYVDMNIDDGDITLETAILDDGNYQFRIKDGSINFVILSGGGKFSIDYDDGSIRYDPSFNLIEEDENYMYLSLEGGNARVRIKGDDMSVRLKTGRIK